MSLHVATRRALLRPGGGGEWWDFVGVVGAYAAKGAASQAASYVNLSDPGTKDLSVGVAPAWSSGSGWTTNGSTHYLDTGIVIDDGWAVVIRVANSETSDSAIPIGAEKPGDANSRSWIKPKRVTNNDAEFVSPDLQRFIGEGLASGVFGINDDTAYINGVAQSGDLGGVQSALVQSLYIGARHAGSDENHWSGDILHVWIGNANSLKSNMAALMAGMAAL